MTAGIGYKTSMPRSRYKFMLRNSNGHLTDSLAFRYQHKMLESERATPLEPLARKRHSFKHPCNMEDMSISGGFVGLSIVPGDV